MTARDQTNSPLCVRDYGCLGNGTAFDGTPFQTAINDALDNNRDLYVPAGTYLMQSDMTHIVRLTVDLIRGSGSIRIFGDGVDSSILKWSNVGNIGNNSFALDVVDATGTTFLIIEDLTLRGQYSGADPNSGTVPSNGGSGLRLANRTIARNVYCHGFYAGFRIDGELISGAATVNTDHIEASSLMAQENFYGLYVVGNVGMTKDWNFNRLLFSRNQRANIACADNAYLSEVTFNDCHFNAAPYAFYKEGDTVQPQFFDTVDMVRTKCEGSGNFAIYGEGGGGQITGWTGFFELHGIETNGNTGLGDDNSNNHSYRPIGGTVTLLRDSAGVVSAHCTSDSHLQVGDAICVYTDDADTSSLGSDKVVPGGFVVKTVMNSGHDLTWQSQILSAPITTAVSATIGRIGGVRCGNLYDCDIRLSLMSDSTTDWVGAEAIWDVNDADQVTITGFGGRLPSMNLRSGNAGHRVNVAYRRGISEAFLGHVASSNSFGIGRQLEHSGSGDVKLSTVVMTVPYAGTALQAGNATTTVNAAGNGVARPYAWLMRSGFNTVFSTTNANETMGVGASYVGTAPAANAVLCEDPTSGNAGNVTTWDSTTTGVFRRIVGKAVSAGSGNFVDMIQDPTYVIKQ